MRLKKILAVLPILLFSGLFGFFLWEIYVVYNNPGYNVDWHGWWITSSQLKGDVFYFRKKFNSPDNIKNAWLLVSASDEFEVYLNGKNVAEAELDSWFPIGIYDVTEAVHLGVNALAIRVEKRSFEGPVKAAIEIGYEDIYGNKHYVFSDETWKLSNREERDSPSGFYWHDIYFNDAAWVNAEILGRPRGLWLDTDPRIYTTSADGKWFWAGSQRELSCRVDIRIPKKPKTGWIRLASRGGYRFAVNEKQVDVQESSIGIEDEAVLPGRTLKVYEIGPFLNHGNNTILVSSYAEGPERGLYIDGIIEGDGWSKRIDQNDFKCFYVEGSTPLLTYKGNPGWTSIKNKQIKQDTYTPIELIILSYSILIFIFCIISVVFIGLTCIFRIITHLPFYSLSRTYLIPSLFLMFVYILRYDTRFYQSFPFQSRFLIFSLCLLFLLWLLIPLINRIKIKDIPEWIPTMIFILILLVGAFLRFKGICQEPLQQDEAGLVLKAQSILERGYPSHKLAPELPVWYVSTSELVSYLQALSFIVFGKSELSLRFPLTVLGTLTIPLLYYFGKMIGGVRIGLLASATYSLLPPAIGMADFGRYPSQVAFFALLTSFLGFVYLRTDKVRYLRLCALSFLLLYFSWQAAALIILPLFLMRIIMGKKERIFKDIKIFLLITAPVITTHLLIRFLQYIFLGDYLLGPALAEVVPSLMYLSPIYDPFYYIPNFFFIESNQFISILFFVGIPLVFTKFKTYKNLVFLYVVPLGIPFLMTNILELNTYRYVYYLLPYVILCACGVLFAFVDYLGYDMNNRFLTLINSVFASIMLVAISSGLFLNLKNFPGITEDIKTNQNIRFFSQVDKAADFLKANIEPEDIVVSFQPHLLGYYLDKVDYFFESRLQLAVAVFPRGSNFRSVHKYSGTPAVLVLDELRRIIGGNKRVWFVETPENPRLLDKDSQEFFDQNKEIMFERYNTKVYLIGSR